MREAQLICFCSMLIVASGKAEADDQPFPSAEAVAQAFQFPRSKLEVENASKDAIARFDGRAVAAWVFTSPEKVFAPVNSVLAEAGTLLPETLKNEFETKLAAAQPDQKLPFKRVQIGDAAGYAGLAGFGPGGAALAVTLHVPSRNQDLQITVNMPFMDRTDVAEDLSGYARLFTGEGGDMLQSLIAASSNAVEIVSNGVRADSTSDAGRSPFRTAGIASGAGKTAWPEWGDVTPAADSTVSQTTATPRSKWIQFAGAVFMVGVLLWYFRRHLTGGTK